MNERQAKEFRILSFGVLKATTCMSVCTVVETDLI